MRMLKHLPLLAFALTSCGGGASGPPPEIQAVTATPSTIIAGQRATLNSEVIGEVDDWSWNLEDGLFPGISDSSNPEIFWSEPGLAEGTVTASNAGGDSAPFAFSFTVKAPDPPVWSAHRIKHSTRLFNTLCVIQGRPMYLQGGGGSFTCTLANGPNPQQESDWTSHTFPMPMLSHLLSPRENQHTDSRLLDGKFAFAYPADDGRSLLLHATTAWPDDPSDWALSDFGVTAASAQDIKLGESNGRAFAAISRATSSHEQEVIIAAAKFLTIAPTDAWDTYSLATGIRTAPTLALSQVDARWYLLIRDDFFVPTEPTRVLSSNNPHNLGAVWSDVTTPNDIELIGLWGTQPGLGLMGLSTHTPRELWAFSSPQVLPTATTDWAGYRLADATDLGEPLFDVIGEKPILTAPSDLKLIGGVNYPSRVIAFRAFSPMPKSAAGWQAAYLTDPVFMVWLGWPIDNEGSPSFALEGQYAAPGGWDGQLGFWYLAPDHPW